MDLAIEPIMYPKHATRIKMEVSIILGEKAIVKVYFYESGSEYSPLDIKMFYVEGDDYKKWGNDDTYILDYIREKLSVNFTQPNNNISNENLGVYES